MNFKSKKRIGKQIVESLKEFVETLESDVGIEHTFNCRRVEVAFDSGQCDPQVVKKTRQMLRASQPVFAAFLGVSVQTLRSWEQGVNVPSDIAIRFMFEIRLNPEYWQNRLREMLVLKKRALAS